MLLGLVGYASDSTTLSSAPPAIYHIAQAEEHTVPKLDPSGKLLDHLPPCGPTENISKVCNSIQGERHKSLTQLVVVNPGAALTPPVTISIVLGGKCPKRITQDYVASTGNRFLYNECEADGNPRQAIVDITLTEPNPAGGVYTHTIRSTVIIDPLYDVKISPLEFMLVDNCDDIGPTDINLFWDSPDKTRQRFDFRTSKGKHILPSAFACSRIEVSASANLNMPAIVAFHDEDPPLPNEFHHGYVVPAVPLVPGVTRRVKTSLKEDTGDCTATMQYKITYTLRFYPFL